MGNEPGAADSPWGEDGDDETLGEVPTRLLDGGSGRDVILGEKSHDIIQARDGEQDITIDCGDGANDAVFFDAGMGTVTNCERQNPSL